MKILFLIMCVLSAFSTSKDNSMYFNVLLAVMSLAFAVLAMNVKE